MKRIAIAVMASALSAVAVADGVEKPYLGLDYQQGKFEQSNTGSSNLQAVRFRLGSEILPNLAVEAQYATGVSSHRVTLNNNAYDVTLNGLYGVFLRPQVAIGSDEIKLFLVGGYSFAAFGARSLTPGVTSINGSSNGFSYGVGADVGISHGWRLGADYINYTRSYKAFSFGVSKLFD